MRIRLANLAALAIILIPGIGISQEKNMLGFHTHDGFYLSMATGFGGGNFSETNFPAGNTDKLEMSGGISHSDLKVGGAVWRNQLILSGDFIEVHMPGQKTTLNGNDYGNKHGFLKGTEDYLALRLLGLGVTYYFIPANVFMSGTIGAGRYWFTTNDVDYKSDRGMGFQLKAGKEWWVSKNWGLGVSMFLLGHRVNQTNNQVLKGGFLGILFNTTFN